MGGQGQPHHAAPRGPTSPDTEQPHAAVSEGHGPSLAPDSSDKEGPGGCSGPRHATRLGTTTLLPPERGAGGAAAEPAEEEEGGRAAAPLRK